MVLSNIFSIFLLANKGVINYMSFCSVNVWGIGETVSVNKQGHLCLHGASSDVYGTLAWSSSSDNLSYTEDCDDGGDILITTNQFSTSGTIRYVYNINQDGDIEIYNLTNGSYSAGEGTTITYLDSELEESLECKVVDNVSVSLIGSVIEKNTQGDIISEDYYDCSTAPCGCEVGPPFCGANCTGDCTSSSYYINSEGINVIVCEEGVNSPYNAPYKNFNDTRESLADKKDLTFFNNLTKASANEKVRIRSSKKGDENANTSSLYIESNNLNDPSAASTSSSVVQVLIGKENDLMLKNFKKIFGTVYFYIPSDANPNLTPCCPCGATATAPCVFDGTILHYEDFTITAGDPLFNGDNVKKINYILKSDDLQQYVNKTIGICAVQTK